jgi:hypothetical protein
MKKPVAIKRVDQGSRGISDSISTKTLLKTHRVRNLFRNHYIGHLWNSSESHEDDTCHIQITWAEKDSDGLSLLIDPGFEYAIGECLKDKHMKHSGAVSEAQSQWFRAFGRRNDGMLAINPLDRVLEYEKYFGNNIAQDRIAYAEVVPPGNVLCFSWLKANYMHLEFNEDRTVDVWMKYHTQINPKMYASPDDIDYDEDEEEFIDSMLVNIRGLQGASMLDELLNGLI